MAITLDKLAESISHALSEFSVELSFKAEIGVKNAAIYLKQQLESRSPRQTGKFASSWEVVFMTKRKDVKKSYIHNSAKGKRYSKIAKGSKKGTSTQIPLINLIEGKEDNPWKGAHPFVRRTLAENEDKITDIILEQLEN